mmetsp:Transcript_29361/g.41200  ORF Transcript_29361/g.41200 Transcript_29361/m.41200 type:complete len:207 (-) Transcript_29361:278-898(-)
MPKALSRWRSNVIQPLGPPLRRLARLGHLISGKTSKCTTNVALLRPDLPGFPTATICPRSTPIIPKVAAQRAALLLATSCQNWSVPAPMSLVWPSTTTGTGNICQSSAMSLKTSMDSCSFSNSAVGESPGLRFLKMILRFSFTSPLLRLISKLPLRVISETARNCCPKSTLGLSHRSKSFSTASNMASTLVVKLSSFASSWSCISS